VGKVSNLCRGLETGISVVLTVRSLGNIYVDGLMMMAILMISGTFLSKEVLSFGISTWVL
jgi:hypothetical protein